MGVDGVKVGPSDFLCEVGERDLNHLEQASRGPAAYLPSAEGGGAGSASPPPESLLAAWSYCQVANLFFFFPREAENLMFM